MIFLFLFFVFVFLFLYCPIQWENYYLNKLYTVIFLLIILLIVGVLIDNKAFVCLLVCLFVHDYPVLWRDASTSMQSDEATLVLLAKPPLSVKCFNQRVFHV